ncbi:hypothetical protein [Leeuwenhoekiella marinoflava]|uniref:hypothetical protein n=1 Tax=Leeuwenhoekiella marinoflava TaxID=988 RepID=UPI003001F1A4
MEIRKEIILVAFSALITLLGWNIATTSSLVALVSSVNEKVSSNDKRLDNHRDQLNRQSVWILDVERSIQNKLLYGHNNNNN